MSTKELRTQTLSFEVSTEGFSAHTVSGCCIGIVSVDSRIEKYMVPQVNRIDVTVSIGVSPIQRRRLLLWTNPKTQPDKDNWTRLTPIFLKGVRKPVQVYASLTED